MEEREEWNDKGKDKGKGIEEYMGERKEWKDKAKDGGKEREKMEETLGRRMEGRMRRRAKKEDKMGRKE